LNFADLLFGFSIFYAFVALFFKFKNRISYGLVNISIPHIQTDPYPASSKTPRAVKLLQEQTLNHWSSRVVFFTPRSDLFFFAQISWMKNMIPLGLDYHDLATTSSRGPVSERKNMLVIFIHI
jgi:hypothetical protein